MQNKFIGNIGAPVESGQWDADSEDLEPEENVESNEDVSMVTSSQNATTTLVPVVNVYKFTQYCLSFRLHTKIALMRLLSRPTTTIYTATAEKSDSFLYLVPRI